MALKYRTTFPLPYIPYSSRTIPATADHKLALRTNIQSANIVGMAKHKSICILFRWFAQLPRFYYGVFAT